MGESISIKNLGPIKDIYIENIKPFTILIGESGSGKSTLMKAIALFRWLYKMHNIQSYLKHSNISKSSFKYRMKDYIKNCGFEQFITDDTEIIYSVKSGLGDVYKLKYTKNELVGADNNFVDKDDIQFSKISFISETRNIIPLWSDRGASNPGGYLGFYFHEVYDDFDLASEKLNDLNINFLGLNFSVEKTNLGKKYIIRPNNTETFEIDFKNSSSGTQTSVPVSLISEHFSKNFNFEDAFNRTLFRYLSNTDNLTDFKPVKNLSEIKKKIYIHIEEPELSLSPDAQCELINDLINKCFINNENYIELFLSTHSPYIINHLNLLIKAFDKDVLINGAQYNYDNLAVYRIAEGKIYDLIVKNQRLVNTNDLSDTINQIYDQYSSL